MHEVLFSIGGFTIYTWSFCVAVGVVLLSLIYIRNCRKLHATEHDIDLLVIVGAIAGVFVYLGSSFFDSLWHAIGNKIEDPSSAFTMFDATGSCIGGVTFEGGIITGIAVYFIVYMIVMKKDRQRALMYSDQFIIGVLIAHACGRIGCWFAGCCYGKVTDSWIGVNYPTSYGWEKVIPTQLIEAGFLLICAVVFFFFVKKRKTEIYFLTYGVYRFFAEYLRGDDRGASPFGALSPSQFMSLVMIAAAVAVFYWRNALIKKGYNFVDARYQKEIPDYVEDMDNKDANKIEEQTQQQKEN